HLAMAVKAGGKGDVTKTHLLWQLKRGSNVSSPVYHDGHLYWSHEDSGKGYCGNAGRGTIGYEDSLKANPGRIYAAPVVADSKIYYVSRTGGTYVLDAAPKFKLLAHNKLTPDTSVFNGSPAISDGQILLRSNRYLYCIANKS